MARLRLVPASGAPIEIGSDSLVGRDPGCDVVLSDGSVSRKHARLERRGEGWAVLDQGSANGTYLDSQRVADAALRAGQEIRFGAVSFRVEIEEETPEATIAPPGTAATVVRPAPIPPLPSPTEPRPQPSAPPSPPRFPTQPASPVLPPPPPPAQRAPTPPPSSPPPIRPIPPPPPPRPSAPPAPTPPRTTLPPPPGPPRVTAPPGRPSTVGVAGPSAPPAPKGRGPLFWIFTGCCGCLGLVVLLAALIAGGVYFMTRGPADAAKQQLAEIKNGEMSAAYTRLGQSYQARMSQAEFEQLVAAHPGLRDNADATFWRRTVEGDTARLSGMLTSTSGTREMVTYELVKEGGIWKISAISFAGEENPPAGEVAPSAPTENGLEIETVDLRQEPESGSYTVRLTIRDLVGGGRKTHEASFERS